MSGLSDYSPDPILMRAREIDPGAWAGDYWHVTPEQAEKIRARRDKAYEKAKKEMTQ